MRHSLNSWKQEQASLLFNITDYSSLDEIIIETFKKYSGCSKSPDINVLLDPKNYFDISFDLKNASGTSQGSNGQSYTAMALLCIARLTLIEEKKQGVRFMPIDEAESIGSNYDMLRQLASAYDYQIISMSIRNLESVEESAQNTYMLIPNSDETAGINCDPFPLLSYGHEQFDLWSAEHA